MRVTEQGRINNQIGYLATAAGRLDKTQQQLASGTKITHASDDPSGTASALSYRDSIAFETQMRRNMDDGTAFLNITDSALSSASDALQRARDLTVQASNGALGASDKAAIAQEINQIIGSVAQVANTDFGGVFIFSGQKSQTAAYQVTGNPPTAVTFQGDTGSRLHRISAQDVVPVNVAGSQAFGTIFNDLITLRDNLNSNAPSTAISPAIGQIDTALDHILASRSDVGARVNRLESASSRSLDTDTALQQLKSGVEDTDMTEAVVNLQAQQNALQAAMGAIAASMKTSLLNFLR
jgi:flagellar hook-associated protein 3 FlgL